MTERLDPVLPPETCEKGTLFNVRNVAFASVSDE
jgi:hypothetical protein